MFCFGKRNKPVWGNACVSNIRRIDIVYIRMRNSYRPKYLICEIKVPFLCSKFAYLNEREKALEWMNFILF